jgi:hypothetical protein
MDRIAEIKATLDTCPDATCGCCATTAEILDDFEEFLYDLTDRFAMISIDYGNNGAAKMVIAGQTNDTLFAVEGQGLRDIFLKANFEMSDLLADRNAAKPEAPASPHAPIVLN